MRGTPTPGETTNPGLCQAISPSCYRATCQPHRTSSHPNYSGAAQPASQDQFHATGVFAPGTPEIYCSAILSNAPPDTEIKAEWVYIQGEADATNALITDSSVTADGTRYVYFSMTAPDTGWPRGNYKVVLYIDGKEQLSVPFSVQ